MNTRSMKRLILAATVVSLSSASVAGPIAPVIEPLAGPLSGTPLAMAGDQLRSLDEQLGSLSGGGIPSAELLPSDPASLTGGDNPVQPVLDQLPGLNGAENPLAVLTDQLPAGGGDSPLAPLTDQLPAGEEGEANPLAQYVPLFTMTIDTLAADLAGDGGTIDAITDVVDTLATEPNAAAASIEAVPPTIETALGNLQANLMALSGAEEEGDSGSDDQAPDFSLVLTTPTGVLTVDNTGPSFE